MKGFSFLPVFLFAIFLVLCLRGAKAADHQAQNDGVYIVYMGAATTRNGSPRADHLHLLNSVLRRKRDAIVHNYKNGFSGFAARLSKTEAQSIAQQPGVVSVFPDPLLQLHTTRSWDFLKHQTDQIIDASSSSYSSNSQSSSSDTIIGILDTGIWPESESFSDNDMDPIPSRWKGTCEEGKRFNSSNCNKKLIGARYYGDDTSEYQTPRDFLGHGTHVASTAAGSLIPNASYYGLAMGTAVGGSSKSRIAMYRVCLPIGCPGSSIMAGYDDAIADGVDVLSLSLGASSFFKPDLSTDPIAIGAFHAVEKGITVVCSAGNDGPDAETVTNEAPWILTVAATTIDRDFESDIVVGGNKVFKGEGIQFSNLGNSPVYPFLYGKSAKYSSEDEARNCNPGSLDKNMTKGKIVLCDNDDKSYSSRQKIQEVQSQGGIGLVLVDDQSGVVAFNYKSFPVSVITSKDAPNILSYITSTKNPVATILPTKTVIKYKPAPTIAYFSSRGPSSAILNLLKPDIAAPGVNILAAWIGNDTSQTPEGKEPPLFNIISGTSMSCPHVSGVAATLKSQNPTWSPAAIRSAIMTTATQTNNLKARITIDSGLEATPFDYGAGEISPLGSLQPGLVYETDKIDYLLFLCYYGYDLSKIKLISPTLPDGFACPKNSTSDLISNINYPSITISKFDGKGSKVVTRTVTNVGASDETIYTASIDAPSGMNVKVVPNKLQFMKNTNKLSYQVTFSLSKSAAFKGDAFGSITWTNGKYIVRSPFVVSNRSG
ncbi:CO(2)-response secreted protease-like [Malania oleifera]|uniref:CO(2)-response secreted protease-like n=1 Tax=Malania oleifera TaxID=397392 RepID=UPI0025ADD887|nr:CO(2)-response secreted protease-like [Malania oleifera]